MGPDSQSVWQLQGRCSERQPAGVRSEQVPALRSPWWRYSDGRGACHALWLQRRRRRSTRSLRSTPPRWFCWNFLWFPAVLVRTLVFVLHELFTRAEQTEGKNKFHLHVDVVENAQHLYFAKNPKQQECVFGNTLTFSPVHKASNPLKPLVDTVKETLTILRHVHTVVRRWLFVGWAHKGKWCELPWPRSLMNAEYEQRLTWRTSSLRSYTRICFWMRAR